MRRTQSHQTEGQEGSVEWRLDILTSSAGVAEDCGVADIARVTLPAPPACVARGTPAGHLSVHVQVTRPGELVAGGGEGTRTHLALQAGARVPVVPGRAGGRHLEVTSKWENMKI